MRKNKLLLLLVLLMTAATGAWAQDAKHLIKVTYREQTRLLEQPLPYATTIGELYEAVTGQSFSDLISTMSAVEMPLTGISSNNTSVVSIGDLNGASTPVTVNADGKATISLNFGSYAQGIFVSAISPLYASMKDGVKDADKWTVKVGEGEAQALPIGGLKGDGSETVTLQYTGRLKVKGVKATSGAAPAAGNIVDLSTLTADYEAQDGDVLTGVTTSYKVTIAAGATVTLDGVTISGGSYCIKCSGDATIILKDGSTNTLTATSFDYPALTIGDANTTLTIQGSTGVLNVTSGQNCAGIGGGYKNTDYTCGNIRIEGGVITAQGGSEGAGIGSDYGANCGDIIITGGTITAKGGNYAAGIGTGYGSGDPAVCGAITIANTVTKVTATKGENAPYSIGKGYGDKASCGTVTIGGTVYWENNNAAVNGGDTYLAQATIEYPAAAKPAATVTTAPTGAAVVGVGKTTALVSGGEADGGTLMYAVTTTNTKPTSTDGFSDAVPTALDITASGTVYVWYYVKGDDTHTDSDIAGPISVTVKAAAEGHALTSAKLGEIVGTDGKVYAVADKDNLPEGVTAVAMLAYKSATTGKSLAIALADEGSMNWNSAKSTCGGKAAIGGKSWKLPTMDEWKQMFSANGGNEEQYTGLNNALSAAGGASSTLQNSEYWSSSENDWDEDEAVYREAYRVEPYGGGAFWATKRKNQSLRVRAVLAF